MGSIHVAGERRERPASGRKRRDRSTETRTRLMRLSRAPEVDLAFVRAEAGEGPPPDGAERRRHDRIRKERAGELCSDMIFAVTQYQFPEGLARLVWREFLANRDALAAALGRPVGITVAALDYLEEHADLLDSDLVLFPAEDLRDVVEVALRDGLTGLYDHATFKQRLEREVARSTRYDEPLSLVLLDLDRFKALNDAHGHTTGDGVLARIGGLIRRQVRAVDVGARYGGEEFGVLLPHTSGSEALILAERLRCAVADAFAGGLEVTVSLGVATHPADAWDGDGLLAAADEALYASKRAGRDRTTTAS